MYFPTLAPATGELLRLTIQSFQIRRFQLRRATKRDQGWLRDTLNREGRERGLNPRVVNSFVQFLGA